MQLKGRSGGVVVAIFAYAVVFVSFEVQAAAIPDSSATSPTPCTRWYVRSRTADMSMDEGDVPGMYMLDAADAPMPLVCLTAKDPDPPPHYDGIGEVTFRVPGGRETQAYFNQGLRFYYGFNNRESYRAFRYAIEKQPANAPCAICYVGEALALGVDINMQTELDPDREAARRAIALGSVALARDIAGGKVTAHGRRMMTVLLSALAKRFAKCPPGRRDCQQWRNTVYEKSLERWQPALGGDPIFAVLFADAVMNVWPWSYWNVDGSPKGPAITIAESAIENAMARYPQDEGLPHWQIHLMEMSGHPDVARPAADKLAQLAPSAGHLVHMPSHIYYRLGDMPNAIKANLQAIAQDEAYFANEPLSRPNGDRYRYGYYPHDIHCLIAASSLAGNSKLVVSAADKLLRSAPDRGNGFRADRYRAVYYLARASFASSEEIRGFPTPLDKQPLALVAYDYAVLWASVLEGNSAQAQIEDQTLQRDAASYPVVAGAAGQTCASTGRLPRDINVCLVAIMTHLAAARIAALSGPWQAVEPYVRRAVAIQDRLPYDEPPPWLYPVRQTMAGLALSLFDRGKMTRAELGDVRTELLRALPGMQPEGQPIGAGVFPGDGWTFYALWQLDLRLRLPAAQDEAEYQKTWSNPASPPDFSHM